GFLSGADTPRSLDEEYRCFNPNGLKLRTYFYDWDRGHRYILNLLPGQVYTRNYAGLGTTAEYYIPNGGKDPEKANPRYHLRGNGVWQFKPALTADGWQAAAYGATNVAASAGGLHPQAAGGAPAEVIYKVQSANVTTSMTIAATFTRKSAQDAAQIAVSTDNGLHWADVWNADSTGEVSAKVPLVAQVNGAYETLVRIRLAAKNAPDDVTLKSLAIDTITALNAKTQPRLNLGKNTIYVGAGESTDSIVLWPELQGNKYKQLIVEEKNVKSVKKHNGYQAAVYPAKAKEDAYLVYRVDSPRDLVKVTYGGRFYNRAPKSQIELFHSFDGGKSWVKSWALADTNQPWDVIHYETVPAPAGCRSALFKYVMNTTDPSPGGCGIYALRIEGDHQPVEQPDLSRHPVEITFTWDEPQADRTLVRRSHTQLVQKLPFTYTIDSGGADHPIVRDLTVNLKGARGELKYGYSDGKDAGGEHFVGHWLTVGRNLAVGKPYTLSSPSETTWGAGDPDGKKLTDGIAGPSEAGGTSYATGAIWNPNKNPVITLDLGDAQSCAAFGMNFHGYPWWDALEGQIKDKVEVLISQDGKDFTSVGHLKTDLRWKDLPVNHVWPDEEKITGGTFRLVPEKPITARYVQYRVTSPRNFCCTELEVLDKLESRPFDLRVALPEAKD
ncbi:MAG TPA: hypothetical protein VH475_23625, partial [Tepidisphaeraceae bacterium]